MSHAVKTEIKVGTPTRFSGDLTDASRWKYSVLAYLHLNKNTYDADDKKIIHALSYMTEGSAAAWAQNFTRRLSFELVNLNPSKFVTSLAVGVSLGACEDIKLSES
jgi:hypothetical protein